MVKGKGSGFRMRFTVQGSRFDNNYFAELQSSSEEGSHFRLTDFVSFVLGSRVIKKKKGLGFDGVTLASRQNRLFAGSAGPQKTRLFGPARRGAFLCRACFVENRECGVME